jgi:NAD(P)-dependent dehydrogenase (short-subunit alcohol dehydrogenase family)
MIDRPLAGQVALVTGAGRGIGRATAIALAGLGAQVMATARTEPELEEVSRICAAEYVVESVSDADGCERIVTETRERFGRIDILINNAGVGSAGERPIWEQEQAAWHLRLAVNLTAPFELTRLVAGEMVQRRSGRIVMVSSTAGEVGGPSMAGYCSSKAGLLGLMRSVAQDVGPYGVTCNAVLPGWVRTEMAERKAWQEAADRGTTVEAIWEERAASYPPNRVLTPEEVAAVIAFLASEQSQALNGEAIRVAFGGLW